METFRVLSRNGNYIYCVSKWFKMFQLVRIIFQCASMIVDFRHIEIINLINKLNKLSFHYVTVIDLISGWGNKNI